MSLRLQKHRAVVLSASIIFKTNFIRPECLVNSAFQCVYFGSLKINGTVTEIIDFEFYSQNYILKAIGINFIQNPEL